MKSLKFNRLVLVSNTTKSANQFIFQERLNLITGKDNSIGKSTLVKNIFWALGCEPDFDDTWKQFDCSVLLDFSIGSKRLSVLRTTSSIYFSYDRRNYKRFNKVTGAYSEIISKLVHFEAKLPKRGDDPILDTPPPAYYFLPFYIDQKRSWTSPWNSFQNLGQYSRWKQPIVKYHTGYLDPKHFEIEEEVFELEIEKKEANEEIKRITTAIDVVEQYVPKNNTAISTEELEEITIEIQEELKFLSSEQELLFNKLSTYQTSKYHLENQLKIAELAIKEIDKDYKFTVENIDGDLIECPLCGTLHDNSIVSRASILSDKQEVEKQAHELILELSELSKSISEYIPELDIIKKRIIEINKKYTTRKNDKAMELTDIIDGFASSSVQRNVEESRFNKEALYKNREDSQKDLKKDQRKLLTKDERDSLSEQFMGLLIEFLNKLNAMGINLSRIKHPTDYNKLFRSGGAAEGTRAVLAYQVAVYRQICSSGNETPASIVIDTPNQQEQADLNYKAIIKLIMKDIPIDSQVILCAMENDDLSKYEAKSNIIKLDKRKLLTSDLYSKYSDELSVLINGADKKL